MLSIHFTITPIPPILLPLIVFISSLLPYKHSELVENQVSIAKSYQSKSNDINNEQKIANRKLERDLARQKFNEMLLFDINKYEDMKQMTASMIIVQQEKDQRFKDFKQKRQEIESVEQFESDHHDIQDLRTWVTKKPLGQLLKPVDWSLPETMRQAYSRNPNQSLDFSKLKTRRRVVL